MILDLNNPVSLLRLRCGDTRDIPLLPDEVYESALSEKNNNLKAAAILCGNYILAQLAFDGQQQMGIITVHGNHVFQQYMQYVTKMVKDPGFSSICPIPYIDESGTNNTVEFTKNWDKQQHRWECADGLLRL